jgi:hypothetical protein
MRFTGSLSTITRQGESREVSSLVSVLIMVSGITAGINYSIRNSLGNERIFELYGLACFLKAVFLK